MKGRTYILRSLTHRWHQYLLMIATIALAGGVVVASLIIGHSVRQSLRESAMMRIGRVDAGLVLGDRFVKQGFSQRFMELSGTRVSSVIMLPGSARANSNQPWRHDLQVMGVDETFWTFAPSGGEATPIPDGCCVINQALADTLGVQLGDTLKLRVESPSLLPRDVPLTRIDLFGPTMDVTVSQILTDKQFGHFSLRADQRTPLNIFINRKEMQQAALLDAEDAANVVLVSEGKNKQGATSTDIASLNVSLSKSLTLADLDLVISKEQRDIWQLSSRRVFFDPALTAAAESTPQYQSTIYTYLVNRMIKVGQIQPITPYSMVTAMDHASLTQAFASFLPDQGLADNQIIINQWLADDLNLSSGDQIELTYFVLDSGRKLVEQSNQFEVAAVVPMEGLAADASLMPDFPDAPAEDARLSDWRPSFSLKYDVRPKDDAYWRELRGTPKAFITLQAGREIWQNRYGNATAIRYSQDLSRDQLEQSFLANVDPLSLGWRMANVRAQALAGAQGTLDFGMLFLSFSFFIVIAALLLTALLFALTMQQRTSELGLLSAIGLPPTTIHRLVLAEATWLALIGSAVALPVGIGFAELNLLAMATIWQDVVLATPISLHIPWQMSLTGACVVFIISIISVWLITRRMLKLPAAQALRGSQGQTTRQTSRPLLSKLWKSIGILICLLGSAVLMMTADPSQAMAAAGAFFGAGALILVVGLLAVPLLTGAGANDNKHHSTSHKFTRLSLTIRGLYRQPMRSMTSIALLAIGTFMIGGVASFQKPSTIDPRVTSSGTGGFTLWLQSSVATPYDLGDAQQRAELALGSVDWSGIDVATMRIREGDEASCLNLNMPQVPRVIGLNPAEFTGRFRFTDSTFHWSDLSPQVLKESPPTRQVQAVVDENTLMWVLKKQVGDSVTLLDDADQPIELKIVAAIEPGILQGAIYIHEQAFAELFPEVTGYRGFLIDTPADRHEQVVQSLNFALDDLGFVITPTQKRLAQLNAVENTYIAILQALGGIGLLLGAVGLGLVAARNLLERRSELALMQAVGFTRRKIIQLVFTEHALLAVFGILVGSVSAGVAVLASMQMPGRDWPITLLLSLLALMLLLALASVYLATRWALSGNMTQNLRNE